MNHCSKLHWGTNPDALILELPIFKHVERVSGLAQLLGTVPHLLVLGSVRLHRTKGLSQLPRLSPALWEPKATTYRNSRLHSLALDQGRKAREAVDRGCPDVLCTTSCRELGARLKLGPEMAVED